jgi:hypothetical protein
MRFCDPNLVTHQRVTTLSLDHGADSQECFENPVEISDRGMQLRSRWCFEIGTQLQVSFVREHADCSKQTLTAEGIVVWCEPLRSSPTKMYQSTLLFLDLPDELKQGLREFSLLLGSAG